MTDHIPSTQVEIGGFVWTIYADTDAAMIERIQKVTKALTKNGFAAPKKPVWGGKPGGFVKPTTAPIYNDDGDPCCPIHHNRNGAPTKVRFIESKDGRPGFWGCPAKSDGTPGETVNARGYCDLRFDLPAPEPARPRGNDWEREYDRMEQTIK